MPDIVAVANSFRSAVLRRERKAAVRLVNAYGLAWNRLKKNLDKLTADIADARAKGEAVNQFWLVRQERYGALLRQVDAELRKFSDFAESTITKQQGVAAKAGLADSVALMEAGAEAAGISATFNKLPVAAVENLVGTLGNGSPLRSLLNQLAPSARSIVEQGLIEGVALGRNPRAIASQIRAGLGGNMTRALSIARTETLRAYRESSRQNYLQNGDVVQGWYWRSGRGRRCCASCCALDGTFHPVTEPMKSHVRCRCVAVPAVKGITVDKGVDWFERQDAQTQRDILGTDKGYELYKRGELKLEDFVGLKRDPLWGENFYQLSVKKALAGEGAFPAQIIPNIIPPRFALTQSQLSLIRNAPPYINEAGKVEPSKIDVRYLGFTSSDPFPVGLENKARRVAVPISDITLGRPALDRGRLLTLAESLAEGLTEKGLKQDPIVLAEKPAGGFVVSTSGNHRVALLKLMGFSGKVEGRAQMQRRK
jgi:SPP1 gp7 family putative phage head morphogenesis protein